MSFTNLRHAAAIVLLAAGLSGQGSTSSRPHAPSVASSPGVELRTDLRYSEVARDYRRNLLDLYRPREVAQPALVMFVHGGGWTAGHKDLYQALGDSVARQGLACAVINTQMVPFVRPAEMAADTGRAFAWLHGHAGELGFDSSRMYLMGHSSGAHLVSWMALDSELQKACGVPAGSVRGVIALSGIYDVRPRHPVLNTVFGGKADARTQASPLVHVQAGAPPFLVVWAEHEMPGLAFSARSLVHRLRAEGCAVEGCELPGADHVTYMFRFGQKDDAITPRVVEFVAKPVDVKQVVASTPRKVKQTANVLAGTGGLPVDLWLPEGGGRALLVLAAVAGDEEGQAGRLAEVIAAGGAAVAVVHCGAPAEVRYPDGMRAVAAAANALLERAGTLGLPADALFLGGIGAGGWLAAGAGTHVELLGRRSKGVLLLGVPGAGSIRASLPGLTAPEGSELTPLQWVRAGGPKVLAIWADRDSEALLRDNRPFAARMIERDSPVTAIELAGRDTAACLAQLGSKACEVSELVLVFLGL